MQHYEQALNSYDLAVSLKDDFSSAWFNRGNILTELGRFKDALDSFKKAYELDKYDEETGFTAMQRLTGWHASIIAILMAENKIAKARYWCTH